MKIIATYKSSEQIAEDGWRVFTEAKSFEESATLKDVYDWARRKVLPRYRDTYRMVGVELCQESPALARDGKEQG